MSKLHRRNALSVLALSLSLSLSLAACGGGGSTAADNQSQVAADLVKSASYPGALTIEVSTSAVTANVAGVSRPQQALKSTDLFPVGSISKSFTATLAGLLVQEGKLKWDTKVLDVLTELRATTRAEYASITIKDLLAHQAGIFPAVTPEEIAQLPDTSGTDVQQRVQLAQWALARTPSANPGKQLLYSNGGYVVAAAMIERIGGASYENILQSKLLQPLGIQARFGAAGAQTDEVQGHVANGNAWTALSPTSPAAQFPSVANPAGGLKVNAAGLGRYLQMHLRALRGQTSELITPATAQQLHQALAFENELGWFAGTDTAKKPLSFHAGSDDYSYYALAAVSKSDDKAGAVIVNGWKASTEADLSAALIQVLK